MDFVFSGNNLTGRQRKLQRFFEIMPGATSWIIITGMFLLAFRHPLIAAVIIISFYIYWLVRMMYLTLFLILSYMRLSAENRTDWMTRVRGLDDLNKYSVTLKTDPVRRGFRDRVSLYFHRKELEALRRSGSLPPASKDIHHLVIMPVAKEARDVIEPGIIGLAEGTFPAERIVVILALEARAPQDIKNDVGSIRQDYNGKFMDMLVIIHPDGVAGEARAKGANATFAAKKAAEYFSDKGIQFDNVIVSCFDSDTVVAPNYFASLTYYFMTYPSRERASFQPVPVYNNNIWDAPGITRVLDVGSSFFQLIEATNPEKLVTFSSHSMSFRALVDVGYWPVDMISDDSGIFWKSFIHFDGRYHVVPMYATLSMDAVVAENWWKTVINVYKQKRRWAWGVENFPIVMRAFLANHKIPLFTKLKCGYKLFEGHISWSTWAFLLTIIGWLPAIFGRGEFQHSVFYYSAPRITGTIFQLASFSLVTSIILSLCLLPKKQEKHPVIQRIGFTLQWLLIPVTMVFLSALPALDAQTRLMLGKYMTFWVTDKSRK